MDPAESAILVLNLVLAIACGLPLARMFRRAGLIAASIRKILGVLLLVYFLESVAFMGSMATSILSIALAILWGILLGSRLRSRGLDRVVALRLTLAFALYTSLPAASFIFVPIVCVFSGWSVTSAEAGYSFGIPEFLPSPVNTILGFCLAVAIVTLLLKTGITTAVVRATAFSGRLSPQDHR